MNDTLKKQLNEYFSNIESLLLCDRKSKKAFLTDLKNDVDEFILQEQNADFSCVLSAFGTPQEIAESFLKNTDIVQIKKRMNIRKLILFSLLAIVLVYLCFVIASFIDVHTESHGFYEEIILFASHLPFGGISA